MREALRRLEFVLAEDELAPQIQRLQRLDGFTYGDEDTWKRVYPHWIVCRDGEKIIACVQVCYGLPFSRLDFLVIDPEVPKVQYAWIMWRLGLAAETLMREYGSRSVIATVDETAWSPRGHWNERIAKYGVPLGTGTLVLRGIA